MAKFWTFFVNYFMLLGIFALLKMAKYWKIVLTSGHTGSVLFIHDRGRPSHQVLLHLLWIRREFFFAKNDIVVVVVVFDHLRRVDPWPQIQVNPRAWDSTFSPSISDSSDDFSQNVSSILPEVYFQKFFRNLWQFEIHNFLYVKCMEMRLSRYSYALLFAFGMAYQCHKPWHATVSHANKNAASDTKYFYAHSTRY